MHVFITGATGFVGTAVVQDLLAAGHTVTGLTRSEAGAAALAALGVRAWRGTLDDVDGLRRAAAAADGVIHTGFDHDFSRYAANCEQDRRAIEALGAALEGSDRPLVVTSGMVLDVQGRPATEADVTFPLSPAYPRASEHAASALVARGVNASVVRLPPSVHGEGDHGLVPMMIGFARTKRVAAFVDDGANRWSSVHRLDAARVFRLALERAAPDARYHAVAEEGVPFHDIAAAIGRRLGVPVTSITRAAAAQHFGALAHFAGMDVPAACSWTRKALDWHPRQGTLMEDVDSTRYFPA
jgi:nucleoside-diphosphate-sugar epimerase